MKNRKTLCKPASAIVALCLAPCLALSVAAAAQAESHEPLKVVATFSILGDMVTRVGGEHVALDTLVGANGDAHVYQPTPQDARVVSEAEVLVVNGLGFEGWLDRLAESAAFEGSLVVATNGVDPIHLDDGSFDPHAWTNLKNALIYVDNITAALAKADPANATSFYQNRAAYVFEIETLDAEIHALLADLPSSRRTVVTPHDAFGYFSDEYGIAFLAPQGISTESEASARDVAELITQIREKGISGVFLENIADGRLLQQIVSETDAGIGGTLYSDALSSESEPAATYIDMMRHNATTLAQALDS